MKEKKKNAAKDQVKENKENKEDKECDITKDEDSEDEEEIGDEYYKNSVEKKQNNQSEERIEDTEDRIEDRNTEERLDDTEESEDISTHIEEEKEGVIEVELPTEENICTTSYDPDIEGATTEDIQDDTDQHDVTAEEQADDIEGETTESVRPRPRPRHSIATSPTPTPTPRTSRREKRKPKWQEEFYMYQMVPRPYDSKLQALDILMNSGVLNRIDIQVAQQILDTLSEKKS
ncbi:structural maintenance of chromosomes protein 4-like [Ruditapes philippinarum]|uniref:structural maintenance of chromosomes protein 4-like n=1 Tax=Ruditapes philippinarum TaxID=129788 RepID=UPI00295AEAA0|nr:structural maintenance of chromosomes protein 4-like [Ruditapes philippinarum]